jgi:G:T-mismatch repair DNA endonuclease (very short patch repair protein)
MRESEIEKRVCAYAKQNQWLAYKFVSPNNRGVPDRIFIRQGVMMFIEFKAPGKVPTKLQYKVMSRIEDEGFRVYVVDSVECGKQLIDDLISK